MSFLTAQGGEASTMIKAMIGPMRRLSFEDSDWDDEEDWDDDEEWDDEEDDE